MNRRRKGNSVPPSPRGVTREEVTKGEVDSGAYDRAYPQRLKDTL